MLDLPETVTLDISDVKDFEKQAIHILADAVLGQSVVDQVLSTAEKVEYDYTGHGYYLTFHHPILPVERTVCDEPMVSGIAAQASAGFIVFILDQTLTLEAHPWGEGLPEDFRSFDVRVEVA